MIKLSILLILPVALLVNSLSAVFIAPCSHYFQFELDETNRVKSGLIHLNVTSLIASRGLTLETVFGTNHFPIEVSRVCITKNQSSWRFDGKFFLYRIKNKIHVNKKLTENVCFDKILSSVNEIKNDYLPFITILGS